ncbi:Ubiquitin carboxyl-terminal hydrolase 14 [Spatholobus suberectus]|nr:Ubiquitin carboxyl-terminal hydrolase 14 [Spatholobus suberectus]
MTIEPLDLLRSKLSRVRIPKPTNRIYKHECCVSFNTSVRRWLFIDMYIFLAFGKDFVGWNYEKTGNPVYLHIKQTKKLVLEDRPSKKPTILAIGVDGGFDNNEVEYEETHSLVILPEYVSLPFLSVELLEKVRLAIDAILLAEGAERKEQLAAWTADKKQDGSGGNNHAIEHYQEIGYPLTVKLGTITADLEATKMTTAERELDQNTNFDWNQIQESGQEVDPIFGPRYTGLVNIGNSSCLLFSYNCSNLLCIYFNFCCYFILRYYLNQGLKKAFEASPVDPTVDINMQLTKLAHGLLSGKYSVPTFKKQEGICPQMFKSVIAASHPEFSSMRQQMSKVIYEIKLESKLEGSF